ncbi:Uncharacterized protein C17orf85-like protein [Harpegnathos saltator]|uniref:Nuclear cap-binding protein subunit 3 n=1 Tax=Harpegnathos saltator TaxID=610380 RepID=E2BZZ1_HARSA|nr:Uncharacterized protein C17orf85-like protein [Harpegnathos saltator]
MDECDESSDIEMVSMEESIHVQEKPNDPIRTTVKAEPCTQDRRIGIFVTGIDTFSKEEKLKMEERAKRFGLTEKLKNLFSDQEKDLYSSMGITDDDHMKNIRLNVIHVRGTEEMSTKDVLKYFKDYAPQSIEWINDISCNVVWFDNLSAARAMLGLSRKILNNTKKYSDGNLNPETDSEDRKDCKDDDWIENGKNKFANIDNDKKRENYINIKDIDYPLPPGTWRKGIDYPKSKGIFLRFATRMDRKQSNAEKINEYKEYGSTNFRGFKKALTESRKRIYKQIQQNKHKLSTENKDQNQMKNPWGTLSETWGLNDVVEDDFLPRSDQDHGRSIKDRLGTKSLDKDTTQVMELGEISSSSDSEENWCKRSKVLRMRMHADDEEEKQQKRRAKLRYQMILNNLNNSGDLRSKLKKPRTKIQYHDPIQVIVTNTALTKPSSLKHDNSSKIIWKRNRQIMKEIQPSEREEGEWQESENESDQKKEDERIDQSQYRQYTLSEDNQKKKEEGQEEEQEEEEKDEHREDEEGSVEEDSNVPAKEIQGPKGSVIKVIPPKPRIASTVWTRLNHLKSEINDSYLTNRKHYKLNNLKYKFLV